MIPSEVNTSLFLFGMYGIDTTVHSFFCPDLIVSQLSRAFNQIALFLSSFLYLRKNRHILH